MSEQKPFYSDLRSHTPSRFLKWLSRYHFEPEELQNIAQQNPMSIYTQILDLTVAQTYGTPLEINQPGRACVIFGINTSSSAAYDPVANTGIEAIAAGAFAFARFNTRDPNPNKGFSLKHNRGFRGDFNSLFLSWPAQANINARLYIFKFDEQTWSAGEAAT